MDETEFTEFAAEEAEKTEKVKSMYEALDMAEEDINLLHDYFDAFANFYLRLSLKDAYKIIKSQNKELVTREKFTMFAEIASYENHSYYILGDDELYEDEAPPTNPLDKIIVECSLVDITYEPYYDVTEFTEGEALYVPAKSLLLQYKSKDFYERDKYHEALYNFLVNNLHLEEEKADKEIIKCVRIIRTPMRSPKVYIDYLRKKGFHLTRNKIDELSEILMELFQNMKNPYFRGLTFSDWYTISNDFKEYMKNYFDGKEDEYEYRDYYGDDYFYDDYYDDFDDEEDENE